MGRNLEAHRQRYLDTGDFPAFWLGFDDALCEDAGAVRCQQFWISCLPADFPILTKVAPGSVPWQQEPPAYTPEELLAAFEELKPIEFARGEATDRLLFPWGQVLAWVGIIVSTAALLISILSHLLH